MSPQKNGRSAASIPALTPITDNVSELVRQQYEENPYPRWVATSSLHLPISFDERIRSQFPRTYLYATRQVHARYPHRGLRHRAPCHRNRAAASERQDPRDRSQVSASLAYATRKARELRVANVEFGQADILQLRSFQRTFDVIELVGVLHHLRDPLEGWRILLSLLRPGGFMRVGLYSALARQQSTPHAPSLPSAVIAEQRMTSVNFGRTF